MRPRVLRLDGFTCFPGGLEPLRFDGVELFAIAGPTGAGKSSLLDAMVFALYGHVPRIGKRGVRELIRAGQDRMSVVFDFEVRGEAWRVLRAARLSGPTEARLERLGADGTPEVVESGVRKVDAAITRLLGLGYDAFVRAVVLPQGKFAAFLESSAGEKQELLRDLLRLSVFEEMRKAAAGEARDCRRRLENLAVRLADDYAGVTPEALDKQERDANAARTAHAAADAAVNACRAALDHTRKQAAETRELLELESTLRELDDQAEEHQADAQRLDAAERAAPVLPALAALAAAQSAEAAAKQSAERAQELHRQAERERVEQARLLQAARADAAPFAQHPALITALGEVLGMLSPRDTARARAERLAREQQALQAERERAKNEVTKATTVLGACNTKANAAEQRAAKLAPDAERLARLDACREHAATLGALRKSLAPARQARTKTTNARERAEARATAARDAEAEAASTKKAAAQALAEAEAALVTHAESRQIAHWRVALTPGAACPVCEQPVETVPEPPRLGALQTLEATRDAAAERLRLAEHALEAAQTALHRADADLGLARQTAADAARHLDALEAELAASEVKLTAAVADDLPATDAPDSSPIEVRLSDALAKSAKAGRRHEKACAASRAAAQASTEARHALVLAERSLAEIADHLTETAEARATAAAEAEALDSDIRTVTNADDPRAERDRLVHELETAEARVSVAKQAERQADTAAAAAARGNEAASERLAQAIQVLDDARTHAERGAGDAGFRGLDEARAAALPAADFARLREKCEQAARQRQQVEARLAELAATLGDLRCAEADVVAAEQALAEAEAEAHTHATRLGALQSEIAALTHRLKRARALGKEHAQAQAEFAVHERLADDLGAKQFQEYRLREAFESLVRGASVRLERLSGRYTLAYSSGDFVIVDHDNGALRRSTDTLSGGETFLTALALALELSEQVQQAAGAVALDSLFLDEGFGSLDAESLDVVAETIEALGEGGRTVGVITHLSELTSRLPHRIEVSKGPDGSTYRVVTS